MDTCLICAIGFFFFVYKLSHCVGTIYLKLLLYLEKISVLKIRALLIIKVIAY